MKKYSALFFYNKLRKDLNTSMGVGLFFSIVLFLLTGSLYVLVACEFVTFIVCGIVHLRARERFYQEKLKLELYPGSELDKKA